MGNISSIKQFISSNKAIVRFILTTIVLYSVWVLIYQFFIKEFTGIDNLVIQNSIVISQWMLELTGFKVGSVSNQIWIVGTHPLFIGDSCNGISLFALFSIIIIALPGRLKHKVIFIPIGILLIHLMNCVRISALCITYHTSPSYLQFNHDYTFKLLVWGFIFLLWMLWIKKFAGSKTSSEEEDAHK